MLDIVDAHLQANNLQRAKKFAIQTLEREDALDMLTHDEIQFLRLVIKLPEIKDLDSLGNSHDPF